MGYTRRKIRSINLSFLLVALVFAGWALLSAWSGWPRGFRGGSTAGFVLFSLAAAFFAVFPVLWARHPEKHPVNHELLRYGGLREMSERLDREMAEYVSAVGPFRFTASLLVYDSAHEFQMIPYDQIARAELGSDDGVAAVIVQTRSGRSYPWYRTWLQGRFDPDVVLRNIRAAAHLDDVQKDDVQKDDGQK
jgi:hypothetical protein